MAGNFCCFVCIAEKTFGVVENLGKFSRVVSPGCVILAYPLESVVHAMTLKIQQLDIYCDTKTRDNVFVKVAVAIQYKVIESKVEDAYYKLNDPKTQIRTYVNDGIRSTIPKMDLDHAFASKGEVAEQVESALLERMESYGYQIMNVLITDIDPDKNVKVAMNEIMAAQRIREANNYKADAEKILMVKAAEADSEAKHLTGIGIARQRKALVDGLRSTVTEFSTSVEGTGPKEVMDLLLLTQYFDTLKEVNCHSVDNTIFLSHNPSCVKGFREELRRK